MSRRSARIAGSQSIADLNSVEGMSVFDFIQGVFDCYGGDDCFNSRFNRLSQNYLSDSYRYLTRDHPDLNIITLRCQIVHRDNCREGLKGLCYDLSDIDDDGIIEEENIYIALPPGLIGNIEDIDPDDIQSHLGCVCWCGGQYTEYIVLSIEI